MLHATDKTQKSGQLGNSWNISAHQNDQQTFKSKGRKNSHCNSRLPAASAPREAYHVWNQHISKKYQVNSESVENQVSWKDVLPSIFCG